MDILHLIDRLEALLNEGSHPPLTKKVMIEEQRAWEIIDQMRIAIPEEVKKAQQVVAQRDRVMAQAQEEANRTLQIARDKADQLVQKDIITQEAQRRADQILAQARAEAEGIRSDADNYILDTLLQLQEQIAKMSNQVNNGILMLQDDMVKRHPSSANNEN